MAVSVSREMILPALRLDVPPRPSERQVAAFAESGADQWTVTPRDWVTQQVVRLAVAEILRARLEQAASTPHERHPLPSDPDQVTLAQLVAWFRPHVGLAAQAFQLGIVEALNAGVPAAVDPVREGLRRLGVTGRDPLRMVSLGVDKVPDRARADFWNGVRSAPALTAVVDALAGGAGSAGDVSGLDRSQLARADAVLLGGGRATAVSFASRPAQDGGRSWLQVPLTIGRRSRGATPEQQQRRGQDGVVEVGLRSTSWVEVFETALEAVGSAMAQIDTGARPKGRPPLLVEALVQRLVAAKARSVAEVCASLRGVDPLALEMFDHQVTTASVRVAVPVVEDDAFMQLWLPTSALAGPLFTGAPDLFMGDGADVRMQGAPAKQGARAGARPAGAPGARPAGQRPGRGGAGGGRPARPEGDTEQGAPREGTPREGGGRSRRGRGRRPGQQPDSEQPNGQQPDGQQPDGQQPDGQQPDVRPVAQPDAQPGVGQPGETQPAVVPAPVAQPAPEAPANPSPDES